MSDRPIAFSAPMVRALIDGRKTQTRRVLKQQPVEGARFQGIDRDSKALFTIGCIYGKQSLPYAPGGRLWVREAWHTASAYDDLSPSAMGGEEPIRYEACGSWKTRGWPMPRDQGRYRHARFMPRWASRLTLIVTDVRVQRLKEISEADAVAEGIEKDHAPATAMWGWHDYGRGDSIAKRYFADPRDSFRALWNSLHGPDAWEANPWVCAISFTVQRGNIDQIGGD